MENTIYYRPEWTCGRYNKEKQVAIYYNLIEGVSFFFEDYSAMVIGAVLSIKKNETIVLSDLSDKTGIAIESLAPFLHELSNLGIVTSEYPSKEFIADYRKVVREKNLQQKFTQKDVKDKLPYEITMAEQLYADKVGGITNVMFELTYNCSEKCVHCYNIGATRNDDEISRRGNREELSIEQYKSLVDQLYEQGLVKVCLSGGDPFSKNIIWDLIDYIYQKGIAIDIFTNGQRIINDVKRLSEYYPRTVGVSIYSGIPEVHDYITRVNGSWQRSMEVVKQLSYYSIPMTLKCCVMRPNVKSYYMVADIANEYGATPQFEVSLTDSIEGDRCVSKYLRMTPEQLEIVLRDNNIPLYVGKEAPNYGGQKKNMSVRACGAAVNSLCITPEGNVIPCCAFHTLFGNVKDHSIEEILESNELAYWRRLTINHYEECGKHEYCDYCNLCSGNNFTEHGSPLKAAEVNCYLAKIRHGLAQKLKNGIDPLCGKSLKDKLSELEDYKPIEIKREMSQNFSDKRLTVGG